MNNNQELIEYGLNTEQNKACQITSGILLILAGAGTGKTKTLTHRIANIIQENKYRADQILVITFTNKAAEEIDNRIQSLLFSMGVSECPDTGTFHSTCVEILRKSIFGLGRNWSSKFTILDTNDVKKMMRLIYDDLAIDEKKIKMRKVMRSISKMKNNLVSIEHFTDAISDIRYKINLKKIAEEYEKRLEEQNMLDFDDLIQKTVQLFEENDEVLQEYQERWKHLMVDEYQDTNIAQYKFMVLLIQKEKNLCVIGDDHQSIYAFRDANYENILNFEKDFPETKVIKLEQNYRSTQSILAAANKLIKNNTTGRKKTLWTENEEGERIQIIKTKNEKIESERIGEEIKKLIEDDNTNYEDCTILYRINSQAKELETQFLEKQIPYQIFGGTRFFDRKEVKDIIAYLHLVNNPENDIAFLRVVNVPARNIGDKTVVILSKYKNVYSMSYREILENIYEVEKINKTKKETLHSFHRNIVDIKKTSEENGIAKTLEKIVEITEYNEYLDKQDRPNDRKESIKDLIDIAKRYDKTKTSLQDFLQKAALNVEGDNDLDFDSKNKVKMMTIHSSKGLEFYHTFLIGWEKGIFPSDINRGYEVEEYEEERRLAYVAITRARKTCKIYHCQQRNIYGQHQWQEPSIFIKELIE